MFIPSLSPPWSDLIDIGLVAVFLYVVILSVRGARAHLALLGIGILACVYLLARQLGLEMTAWLFQAFTAVFLILLIVMFQGELRQIFERVAVFGLRRSRSGEGVSDATQILARALTELASNRRGALVVLPGRDPIERHIEGGIRLEGQISMPLLLSLFDPHSPGHDGAVVLDGRTLRQFAVHLPLSSSFEKLGLRGTRHAAALGLAERTDALCAVVSEERGTISLARDGELRALRHPSELSARLREFAEERAGPQPAPSARVRLLRTDWRELALALGLSLLLWALVVPGAKVVETAVRVRVTVENLPTNLVVESIDPSEVDAVVSGLRRDLFLLDSRKLAIPLDGFLVGLGRRTFELTPQSVRLPPGLEVAALEPSVVRLKVVSSNGAKEADVAKPGSEGPESEKPR